MNIQRNEGPNSSCDNDHDELYETQCISEWNDETSLVKLAVLGLVDAYVRFETKYDSARLNRLIDLADAAPKEQDTAEIHRAFSAKRKFYKILARRYG
jgi:hypothetical protein